ncbi:MAG: response regulator transcription factor [Ferruginibacter sp.]
MPLRLLPKLIANGMSNNEIVQQLFLSVSTADTYCKNLLAKFKCCNIASLVKFAVQNQMI